MKDIISTLYGKITVIEHPDESITISRHHSHSALIFHSRQEWWDFVERMQQLIPNRQTSLEDTYLGERGKYD